MRVLVTGGSGFVGAHVCALLTSKGHVALSYDQGSAKAPDWLKNIRTRHGMSDVIIGDILDTKLLAQSIRDFRAEVLIHLAAMPGVAEAEQNPGPYLRVNVEGVESVLEACASEGLARIVHASSSSVYGHSIGQINENHPLNPIGQYGQTKMMGEERIRLASKRGGMHARILRPFTVIGPLGRPDMAAWRFSESIMSGNRVRLHVGSGRDFTSVQDVATAFVLAAEQPWDGCETYNIGAGEYHTAAELAELLAKELGLPLHAEEAGLPLFMPKETWADSSSASQRIGWRPKVTFPAAVREFALWYQSNAPHG
jgi:UDP-glucuronate 4-epimerase